MPGRRPSRGLGGEKEAEEVGLGIEGDTIQRVFEKRGDIGVLFFQGVQHAHERFPGMGAFEGLGPEADFAGDDEGAQIAFGEVVVGRDAPIVRPMEQPVGLFAEDRLEGLNRRMPGRRVYAGTDVAFDARGLLAERARGAGHGPGLYGG